jgi:signal transduction histidine kinase
VRDLTRLYLKATAAQRTKDNLLAVTAHELRHPLHLMRMALARHLEHEPAARETLGRYIARMTRLIDDLVDFARNEQGVLELHCEWIDVHHFLVELMDDYRTTFDERKIRLSVSAPVGLRISADLHRLIQVFSNLLDNALKFTPAGGAVTVDAVATGGQVVFTVRDSGRGLAADVLPRVLDLPTNLASPHGLGIGLSVSRRVVELHGGSITVDSAGPGHGTLVTVTLPLHPTMLGS